MGPAAIFAAGLVGLCLLAAPDSGQASPATEQAAVAASETDTSRERRLRWRPGMKAARAYARSRNGDIAFAVDLGSRRHMVHGGRMDPMASTVKVMIMVAYLRSRPVHDRVLSDRERRLIRLMIRRSDDIAATTLRDRLGHRALPHMARAIGMKDFRYSEIWGLSESSPRSQADFMRRLPDLLPARHRGFALRQLARITPSQRWGIGQLAPKGWRLYFKGGWAIGDGTVDHQVALLSRGGERIGLAIQVMHSPSHAYGKQTLRGIAARLLRGIPG